MSVSNVTGVGRVALPTSSAGRPADTSSPSAAEPGSLVQHDEVTKLPVPPRFPWLSRLQRELEPASKQPSPYGSLPILGEKLDKQA
jgi:hypothetical protein